MSAAAEARVSMVNRALIKLGQPASYSIDQETSLGEIADTAWLSVEAHVASLYDWSFNRTTVKLTALATVDNGWTYGYALPGNRIGEPLAILKSITQPDDYLRDYMIEQGNVYAEISPLWARIRVASDPTTWDAGYAEAYCIALAAAMAVPLLQDEEREAKLEQDAFGRPQENGHGGMFGRLIALNKAAQPQGRRFMDNDPLTAARRG